MVATPVAAAAEAPISCDRCPVGKLAVYAPLLADDPARITAERRALIEFAPHQTIIRDGELPNHVYTLFSGWAYRFKNLADGGRQILSFAIPGDFPGGRTLTGMPLDCTVKALTPVVVCAFERERFLRLAAASPQLQASLANRSVENSRDLYRSLTDIGRRSASARVASFILSIGQRLAARGLTRGPSFDFPIPQSFIADALGLTGVYVNRTMSELRRNGLVDFRRNEMTISNREALEKVAAG